MAPVKPRLEPLLRWLDGQRSAESRVSAFALLARLPGVLLGFVLLAATPDLGRDNLSVALLMLGCASLNVLVHLQILERWGRRPVTAAVVDAALCWYIIAALPRSAAGISLVTLALVFATPYQYSKARSRVATAILIAGVIGGYATAGLTAWPLWSAAFALTAVLTLLFVTALANSGRRLRARYGSLVEGLDVVIWEVDPATLLYTFVSAQAEQILGRPPRDWMGTALWGEVDADQRERLLGVLKDRLDEGHQTADLEYRVKVPGYGWMDIQDRISIEADPMGTPVVVRGVSVEVTELRKGAHQRRQFADLVHHIGTALMILEVADDRLIIDAANPAAELAVGRPVSEMVGKSLPDVVPHLQNSPLLRSLLDVAATGEPHNRDGVLLQDPALPQQVFAADAFALSDHTVAVSLTDITTASMASAALRRQARHDELTGLPNRSHFRRALEEAIRERPDAAMLLLDLNQFKEVNDALGHHHGDLLLIEVSHRLRALVPETDLVARLGGDEFAVLLVDKATIERAEAVARQIREALEQPFVIGTLTLQTNASIGIARYPDHAQDAESLTKRADVAMYLAKRTGVGCSLYAPDQDRSSIRKLTLISELRRAMENGEFTVHYQPMIALLDGKCHHAEALVRWHHPEQGLLLPEEFIRLAEVSGVIQPLTRWVLEQAVSDASSWHARSHHIGVAVNLSVRNLYEPDLAKHLGELLGRRRFPSSYVTLELTESELMDDPHQAAAVLRQLADLGVATSVDDFGKGYSSLTYLKDLPLGQLKIDQSFVAGMRRRSRDLAIVRSMVELGHSLGLKVVAEGVTNVETLDTLTGLGCDLAQGFLIGRPVTSEVLVGWLDRHQGADARLADTGSALPGR